jgi:GT2 family glycosyltransferase
MIRPIILSRTDSFLVPLLESMEHNQPGSISQAVVADNGLSAEMRQQWYQPHYVPVPQPFCFSKAVNLAVATTRDTDHLLILNDDTEAATTHYLYRLRQLIEFRPDYGLISCSIEGGAYNKQNIKDNGEWASKDGIIDEPEITLAFIAIVITRPCWNAVGPMDEQFTGYGYEDNDYCLRSRKAGFKTGITRSAIFRHGREGKLHSSSFLKYHGQRKWNELRVDNQIRFNEKWGIK